MISQAIRDTYPLLTDSPQSAKDLSARAGVSYSTMTQRLNDMIYEGLAKKTRASGRVTWTLGNRDLDGRRIGGSPHGGDVAEFVNNLFEDDAFTYISSDSYWVDDAILRDALRHS